MSTVPRVSVVLPVFNGERYVGEAVRSILDQTFRDFELLLIDDGSTDGTGAIVRALAAGDARIRLVQRENRGLVASLNEGLAMARGEYVARMDADDRSEPERLARQVACLDAHPGVAVLGVRTYSDPARRWRQRVLSGRKACTWALLFSNHLGHPGVMLRRDVMVRHGLRYRDEFFLAEDYRLWCEMSAWSDVDVLPEPLLFYRRHGDTVSARHAAAQARVARRVACDQVRARLGIDLSDAIDAPPAAWARLLCERIFASNAFRMLPPADRRAVHVAFQDYSAVYGWRLFVAYVRLVGVAPLRWGLAGGLGHLYRVLKHSLKATP